MPTYDYKCQKCGHQYEVVQSMKDDRFTDCPLEGCDGQVKRLLGTGAGIIFKGSGFYETDYRSASYKKGESAEKASSTGDSGSASAGKTSTDPKPAAASSPAPASAPASAPTKSDT